MSKQGTDQQLRQYAAELEQQAIRRRLIYSGCGCDVIEHFPDYCPTCRIAELEARVEPLQSFKLKILELEATIERVRGLRPTAFEVQRYKDGIQVPSEKVVYLSQIDEALGDKV